MQHLEWVDHRAPVILLALALAGGAWEAFRSRYGHGKGLRLPSLPFAVAAVALFVVPLLVVWRSAVSDGCTAFGLLPWSDAGDFYRGAQNLLETGELPPWNLRRPLYTVLLSVLLPAAGHDIRVVQLLQSVIMGLAAYSLSRVIGRDLGWPGGLATFAILLAFGRKCGYWLLSEWLGLTMGALALALLWNGVREGRKAVFGSGAAMLTLALNARSGAFLVLPALALWAGFAFRDRRWFSRGAAATAVAGILLGFLLNGTIMKIYGNRFGIGHGNFSMTLYGLASGTPGWRQIYHDFPETRGMREDALMDFAYRKSFERIAGDPSGLARSLALASREALSRLPEIPGLDRTLTRDKYVRRFLVPVLAAGGIVFLFRFRRRPEITMVAASLAGCMSSVPFLWFDGGDRVHAATVPFLAVFLSSGACWLRRREDLFRERTPGEGYAGRSRPFAVAAAALVAVAAIGPVVAMRATEAAPAFTLPETSARESAVIRSGAPRIEVLRPGDPQETFVPRVSRIDYFRNLPDFAKEDFRRLPRPGVVYYARDFLRVEGPGIMEKFIWVAGPLEMAADKPGYLLLKGTYRRETNFFHVSEYSVLPEPRGDPRR